MGSFPRRAVLISLVLPVLTVVLTAAIAAGLVISWHNQDGRATTIVTGSATAVTDNDVLVLDVSWKDADDQRHQVSFPVVTPVPEGAISIRNQPFRIRYDPADPDGFAFPVGDDARQVIAPAPPWGVFLVVAPFLLLTAAMATAWWWRIRAARVAAAGPGRPYRGVPYVVRQTAGIIGAGLDLRVGVLLIPADVAFDAGALSPGKPFTRPPGSLWQTVMWSPVLSGLVPSKEVTAHLSEGKGARAVLTTSEGTMWPIGPLRDKDVSRRLRAVVATRRPATTRVRPSGYYLGAPLLLLLVVPLLLSSPLGPMLAVLLILLGFQLMIFLWAWRGGVPAGR